MHSTDTYVRTQYLSFLLKLPAKFSDLRADAARQTATWLEEHRDDYEVRRHYLLFLSEIKPTLEWQQVARVALSDAVDLTIRSGYPRQHQSFVPSLMRLHLALLESLELRDSDDVRKVLKISHDAAAVWCERNPAAGLQYDLPLP